MNIFTLEKILKIALQGNYLFENEAQFRDAFVYELRKTLAIFDVKIEVHFDRKENGRYSSFDIVLKDKSTDEIIPIELKYCKFDYKIENIIGKTFNISNNFYKRIKAFKQDVKRIGNYLNYEPKAHIGYAILLTLNSTDSPNGNFLGGCVKGLKNDYSYAIKEIKA